MPKLLGRSLQAHMARTAYLFIAPILIYFAVFKYYPIIKMIDLTFLNASGLNIPQFVGLRNYKEFFADPIAIKALTNSLLYLLYWLPSVIILALFLALLLNKNLKMRRFFRAAYFSPVITSMVAVSLVWKWLYNPSYGIFNYIFEFLGLPKMLFLRSAETVLPSVALVGIWKSVGYFMIIILAGLQSIPEIYYESAIVDGANDRQKFWYITLPLLRHTLVFAIMMAIIQGIQVFDSVYVMTYGEAEDNPGGPMYASMVMVLYIVQQAFRNFRYSYGATLSLVLFIILLGAVIIQTRLYHYESEY